MEEEHFEDVENVSDIEQKIKEIEEEAIEKTDLELQKYPKKRNESSKEIKKIIEDLKDLRTKFEDISHNYFIDEDGDLKEIGKGGRGKNIIRIEKHLSKSVSSLEKLYTSLTNLKEYKEKYRGN